MNTIITWTLAVRTENRSEQFWAESQNDFAGLDLGLVPAVDDDVGLRLAGEEASQGGRQGQVVIVTGPDENVFPCLRD